MSSYFSPNSNFFTLQNIQDFFLLFFIIIIFCDSNKVFCFKWADGNKARVTLEVSSLINNGKGGEDGSSLISHEKAREKSGSSCFQLSVQLCLDWRGQKVYDYWNFSTRAPAGPDTTLRHVFMVQWELPGHNLPFKQSLLLYSCLSYSLTLPGFFF